MRYEGWIKWFDAERKRGAIVCEQIDRDVIVQGVNIYGRPEVVAKARVRFTLMAGKLKPEATAVVLVGHAKSEAAYAAGQKQQEAWAKEREKRDLIAARRQANARGGR